MTKLKVETNAIVVMTDRWTNKYYLANYCYNLKKSQDSFPEYRKRKDTEHDGQ